MSIFEKFPALRSLSSDMFPNHIVIIPDGNGRWAKQHGLPVTTGHQKGYEVADTISRELCDIEDISFVTYWGFSSDNWKRDASEVKNLMQCFGQAVEAIMQVKNRRFIHLGRKDRLPKELALFLQQGESHTAHNSGQTICLAIDFGGDDQMIRMLEKARHIPSDREITKDIMLSLRDGKGIVPPADLLIRTSGEKRTSDVGWLNGAPTELYFIERFFPDITTADVVEAILDFSKRERRFGNRK